MWIQMLTTVVVLVAVMWGTLTILSPAKGTMAAFADGWRHTRGILSIFLLPREVGIWLAVCAVGVALTYLAGVVATAFQGLF